MENTERLDKYLVETGQVSGRDRAHDLIQRGLVTVNGRPAKKAGQSVSEKDKIEVLFEERYVGRGGYKLEAALSAFSLSPKGCVCLDVGASTGGFTDCMLQNGAKKVYAVDVGRDQLAKKLRGDPRVVSMEQTDIRDVPPFSEPIDFFSVDVSFISLKQVLPFVYPLLAPNAIGAVLIKPQFEAGRKALNKRGIVTDPNTRTGVTTAITAFCTTLGFHPQGMIPSPLPGGDGNIEFLLALTKPPENEP